MQEDILSFTPVVVKHWLSLVIDEYYAFFCIQIGGHLGSAQRKWLIIL
jgi:hypothetical protein